MKKTIIMVALTVALAGCNQAVEEQQMAEESQAQNEVEAPAEPNADTTEATEVDEMGNEIVDVQPASAEAKLEESEQPEAAVPAKPVAAEPVEDPTRSGPMIKPGTTYPVDEEGRPLHEGGKGLHH